MTRLALILEDLVLVDADAGFVHGHRASVSALS
jgi:hypothetical protein